MTVLGGCGDIPINDFEVLPKHCCGGDIVTITWDTEGETTITADPRVNPPLGRVDNTGSESRIIDETTTFSITATDGDATDTWMRTVEVIPADGKTIGLTVTGTCVGGSPQWVVARIPSDWSDSLEVGSVINRSGQDIRVSHRGASNILIGENDVTTALDGELFSGDWVLSPAQPLAVNPCPVSGGGETRGGEEEARAPALPSLIIDVHVVCRQ
jgi:hypothetical protein